MFCFTDAICCTCTLHALVHSLDQALAYSYTHTVRKSVRLCTQCHEEVTDLCLTGRGRGLSLTNDALSSELTPWLEL